MCGRRPSYLSKRAWAHSNGHWAGRCGRTRPSVAGHPCSCIAPWRQRWICLRLAPHWEEIQDGRSSPLCTAHKDGECSKLCYWICKHSFSSFKLIVITLEHKRLFSLILITPQLEFISKTTVLISLPVGALRSAVSESPPLPASDCGHDINSSSAVSTEELENHLMFALWKTVMLYMSLFYYRHLPNPSSALNHSLTNSHNAMQNQCVTTPCCHTVTIDW